MQVIIVGGGWAGCAAAYAAASTGARVMLLEKTDMLLGTGLVGGIMCNNGRFTALEEIRALGGADLVDLIYRAARHSNLNFPGHEHALLYDVTKIEPAVRGFLQARGVDISLQTRMTDVFIDQGCINGVVTSRHEMHRADVFVDATGSAGPAKYCTRFGQGCAMCILRCPTFGPRTSICAKAGLPEIRAGEGLARVEAMSGSCKLEKASLAATLVEQLEREGVLEIPLTASMYKDELLSQKACQQYALQEYARNLIILDTGHAKLMTPYFPLASLRTLPGFVNARYADPYAGGRGNSVRFMDMAYCSDALQVPGVKNLFCAGEKTGPLVGHTEAIATGLLAGHNAVRLVTGREPLALPTDLAVGDLVAFMHREMQKPQGLSNKYTFSGSVYFARMQRQGLYTTDPTVIKNRVARTGFAGLLTTPLYTGG